MIFDNNNIIWWSVYRDAEENLLLLNKSKSDFFESIILMSDQENFKWQHQKQSLLIINDTECFSSCHRVDADDAFWMLDNDI